MTTQHPLPAERRSVAEYVAAVASGSPAPGGGSVAATVAALAAGLAEMVCNLTLAGKHVPADPTPLSDAVRVCSELRVRLLRLAADDERAFAGYAAAAALPKGTQAERESRKAAVQAALVHAADVPLETAHAALEALRQLRAAAEYGTKHALSDTSTGALLARDAALASLYNIRSNAGFMNDESLAARYRAHAAAIAVQAESLANAVFEVVAAREG